ncbi:MAG: flavin reductase [Lentisphaeria bacterium]|nr:flavin reductase [Lentisphaeria bacterium]
MKKDLGVKNWIFPMPVLMVGSYDADGTPDMMAAAWGGVTYDDRITVCIDTAHRTWTNIAASKAFTVAFATADTVEACDYLGIVSAKNTPDKVARCGFTVRKSRFVNAPVADQLPLVLECELIELDEKTCRVVGRIVNCAADDSVLTDGKPDAEKMKPLCYDPCGHVYRIMGETVARAFSCGKKYTAR